MGGATLMGAEIFPNGLTNLPNSANPLVVWPTTFNLSYLSVQEFFFYVIIVMTCTTFSTRSFHLCIALFGGEGGGRVSSCGPFYIFTSLTINLCL